MVHFAVVSLKLNLTDRSVSLPRSEDTTSFLATKVGSRVCSIIGRWQQPWGRWRSSTRAVRSGHSTWRGLGTSSRRTALTRQRKRSVLLAVIGPPAYKRLRDLVSPEKPGDKTYEQLVKVMTEHFSPVPSEIVQRYKFHSRFRQPGESVATFVAELRSLAEFCNFQQTLDDMLRDRVVCGINEAAIQRRLLAKPRLTLQKAMELALGMESAAQNSKELQQSAPKRELEGSLPKVHQVATDKKPERACFRCGKPGHQAAKCKFKGAKCHHCGKTGHLQAVCRSKSKGTSGKESRPRSVRLVQEEEEVDSFPLYVLRAAGVAPPIRVSPTADSCPLTMEVDTGAAVSIVSQATFEKLWPNRSVAPSTVRLQSYSGESIAVVGSIDMTVQYQQQSAELPLLIVQGDGPTLLGRNWLTHIKLDWQRIHHLAQEPLQSVLQSHEAVFENGLGTLKDHEVSITVDSQATPRFCKSRPVPYALRPKVEAELDRLVSEGTLEPVQYSEWASPIVTVVKSDKTSVRICGDFKQTVNPVARLDRYPIPKVDDLFATLANGVVFSKLDLSHAYQQLPLTEDSKKFVVINTHKGLFRFTRLPFGISSAPAIFQRVMESILQGIPKVVVYLDDILVAGDSVEEHLRLLDKVLDRLQKAGLRARKNKCQFMVSEVSYLGHRIDKDGLHPLDDKVKAIVEAPAPRNVRELKSYLGILTYYGKFLPDLSAVLAPLYRLLRKQVSWRWSSAEREAFQVSKDLLSSSPLLVHFDPQLPLTLACDASAYGVGAVLSHRWPDGSERPIAYASRSLSDAERNYSQLEKEGLAIVYGVKHFHTYLFGHSFELVTDHQPLLALLNEKRPTSPQASARVRRWSLLLSAYEYTLVFRKTEAHGNADALSRLPLPVAPAETQSPPELVLLMEQLEESPVTAEQISSWTRRDPSLSVVLQALKQGWPSQCGPELAPYTKRKLELSVHGGCVLWGSRVVVPPQGRKAILQQLHEGHPGMSRMKGLARMYVWWPGLDKEIEDMVRSCQECQACQPSPPAAPLHPWRWPTRPWARLHLDYAGPIDGKMFLVIIDAHSKWIEVFGVQSASSSNTVEKLRIVFSQFGIPETIVTDNGSCFVSEEFQSFLRANGISLITSAPYHPASNGLAERAVQILKNGLKKVRNESLNSRLAKILFSYRLTPQGTTGEAPAELLLGRRPRSRLDLARPNLLERVESKQQQQKAGHDSHARIRTFQVGDTVYARNFRPGEKWLHGSIVTVTGPVSFVIELTNGARVRRHQDQLRHRSVHQELSADLSTTVDTFYSTETFVHHPVAAQTTPAVASAPSETSPRRYPRRSHRAPDRYEPTV